MLYKETLFGNSKLLFFSFMVLSKYEEIVPTPLQDLCDITDNTYSKQQV
jgi:hypothetical protein